MFRFKSRSREAGLIMTLLCDIIEAMDLGFWVFVIVWVSHRISLWCCELVLKDVGMCKKKRVITKVSRLLAIIK
jgi:hypothetical protein